MKLWKEAITGGIELRISHIELSRRYDTRQTTKGKVLEREEEEAKQSPTSSPQSKKIITIVSVVLSTLCCVRASFISHRSNNHLPVPYSTLSWARPSAINLYIHSCWTNALHRLGQWMNVEWINREQEPQWCSITCIWHPCICRHAYILLPVFAPVSQGSLQQITLSQGFIQHFFIKCNCARQNE